MQKDPVAVRYAAEMRFAEGTARPLERDADRGVAERIRAGAYVATPDWSAATGAERHLLRVRAAQRAASGRLVFSHHSAAAIWGIPLVADWPDRVHITHGPGGSRSTAPVIRHQADLLRQDVVARGRLLVTGPARTALDLAATLPLTAGVAAVDHVRRRLGVRDSDLEERVALRRPFRGVRRVERALEIGSGQSDSALESILLVRFAELGFERPEQQWEFTGADGVRRRTDFRWGGDRPVIVEADGRSKFSAAEYLAGRTPEQVLWAEKVREDELRAHCSGFARVYWSDAWNLAVLRSKLLRAGVPHAGVRRSRR